MAKGASYRIDIGNNNPLASKPNGRAAIDSFLMNDFQDLGGKNNPTMYRIGSPLAEGKPYFFVNGFNSEPAYYCSFGFTPHPGTKTPGEVSTPYAQVIVCLDAGESGGPATVIESYKYIPGVFYPFVFEGQESWLGFEWWSRCFFILDGGDPSIEPIPGLQGTLWNAVSPTGMLQASTGVNMAVPTGNNASRSPATTGVSSGVWP